ncbi:MAG: hypothetical protein IBJ18_11610 [Phycisphaerales bacterium]|nr:hypothetical protein [Phycisphaerales bacterium]
MPTFGSFTSVQELVAGSTTKIYIVQRAGEAQRYAVKFRHAVDDLTGEKDAGAIEDFLRQADVQKSAGAGFATVHETGQTDDGAFYVTDLFVTADGRSLNLDTLFAVRRLVVDDVRLSSIVVSITGALEKLQDTQRRGHGNLKPTNVLLRDPGLAGADENNDGVAASEFVFLCDPLASDVGGKTTRDDLPALASLIHLMVFKQPLRRTGMISLREVDAWTQAGVDGAFWRSLTADLAGLSQRTPAIDQVRRAVQKHLEMVGGGKPSADASSPPSREGPKSDLRPKPQAQTPTTEPTKPAGGASPKGAAESSESLAKPRPDKSDQPAKLPESIEPPSEERSAWESATDSSRGKADTTSAGGGKKIALVAGGAVAVLALGAGAFFLTRGKPSSTEGTGGTKTTSAGEATKTGTTETTGGTSTASAVSLKELVPTADEVTARKALAGLFGTRSQNTAKVWADSGDATLKQLAELIKSPLSSDSDEWEAAIEAGKEPARAEKLDNAARGKIVDDRKRLGEVASALKSWPVLGTLDQVAQTLRNQPGLAPLGEQLESRVVEFRKALTRENDFGSGDVRRLFAERPLEFVTAGASAQQLQSWTTKLGELRSLNDANLSSIADAAQSELQQGAGSASLAELVGKLQINTWNKTIDDSVKQFSRTEKAWDRALFTADIQPLIESTRNESALTRLSLITAKAGEAKYQAVEPDPRSAWGEAQKKQLADAEQQLTQLEAQIKSTGAQGVDINALKQKIAQARADLTSASEVTGPLYRHALPKFDSAKAATEAKVASALDAVSTERQRVTMNAGELVDQLKNAAAGQSGLALVSAQRIAAAAASLDKAKEQDVKLAWRLKGVQSTVLSETPALLSALEQAKSVMPGGQWPSEAWRTRAAALAQVELEKATDAAIAAAREGNEPTINLAGAKQVLNTWSTNAAAVLSDDANLAKLVLLPDAVAPGSAALSPNAATLATSLKSKIDAMKDQLPAGAGSTSSDVLPGYAAYQRLATLIAADSKSQRAAFLDKLKAPASAAEAVVGVEKLTASADWPASVDDYKALVQGFSAADVPISRLDEALREPARDRLRAGALNAYLRLMNAAATNAPGVSMSQVISAYDDKLIPEARLPSWAKYNFALAKARANLRPDAPEAAVKSELSTLIAAAKDQSIPASARTPAAKLADLLSETGPSFNPAGEGPAKTGKWKLDPAASVGGLLVYVFNADPSRRVSFAEVGQGSQRAFISTTEVSLGVLQSAIAGAGQWADFRKDMGTIWGPTREGAQAWIVSGEQIALATAAAGDLSRGWFPFDKGNLTNVAIYPQGLEPPAPSWEMPAQMITPAAAVRTASALGCRLPSAQEWLAAVGGPSGADSQIAFSKLRDAGFREFDKQTADLAGKFAVRPGRGAFTLPNTNPATVRDPWPQRESTREPVLFRAVTDQPGASGNFRHLVGNVAEFVWNDPASCTVAGASNDATMEQNLRIIGASALSSPSIKPSDEQKPQRVTLRKAYTDVGFRLAFSAQGTEPLAQRAARAVDALPFAPAK